MTHAQKIYKLIAEHDEALGQLNEQLAGISSLIGTHLRARRTLEAMLHEPVLPGMPAPTVDEVIETTTGGKKESES